LHLEELVSLGDLASIAFLFERSGVLVEIRDTRKSAYRTNIADSPVQLLSC
jgi:hypothetical protein